MLAGLFSSLSYDGLLSTCVRSVDGGLVSVLVLVGVSGCCLVDVCFFFSKTIDAMTPPLERKK